MPLLTENERGLLVNELRKMFVLHDRPVSDEKISIFVEELEKANAPLPALIGAIRKLAVNEDVRQIKIGSIFAESRRFIEPGERERVNCPHCVDGAVVMKDDEKRSFGLACICANGNRLRQGKDPLLTWNGELEQYNAKGKHFTLAFNTVENTP